MGQGPKAQSKTKRHKANEVMRFLMCVSIVNRLLWIHGNTENKTKQTDTCADQINGQVFSRHIPVSSLPR